MFYQIPTIFYHIPTIFVGFPLDSCDMTPELADYSSSHVGDPGLIWSILSYIMACYSILRYIIVGYSLGGPLTSNSDYRGQ